MHERRLQSQAGTALLATGICCGLLLSACGGSKGSAMTGPAHAAGTTTGGGAATGSGATGSGATTGKAAVSRVVSARIVAVTAGTLAATMTASGHDPRVNVPWPVRFVVKDRGRPAQAEVRYEYLFGGAVVAHRSRYRFTGSFHDTFNWPASAVGYPLTFRAVILSAGATLNLDYPVQVRR